MDKFSNRIILAVAFHYVATVVKPMRKNDRQLYVNRFYRFFSFIFKAFVFIISIEQSIPTEGCFCESAEAGRAFLLRWRLLHLRRIFSNYSILRISAEFLR